MYWQSLVIFQQRRNGDKANILHLNTNNLRGEMLIYFLSWVGAFEERGFALLKLSTQ